MSLVTSASKITQCLAAQVRTYRRRQDLTLAQLAEKCAELGAPQLSYSALANIERGATADAKRKPRDVSLDELAVLARALDVPPVMLLFPIGTGQRVEITPGFDITAWDAAQWFSGELFLAPEGSSHFATPVYLYRQHAEWVDKFIAAPEAEQDKLREATEQMLQNIRAEMRRHGITPPDAPAEFPNVDQGSAVRMSAVATLSAGGEVTQNSEAQ